MKRLTPTIAALVLASGVLVWSDVLAGPATAADPNASTTPAGPTRSVDRTGNERGFQRFLARYEAANSAFLNGDPGPWLAITTEHEPASIFGGFGGLGDAGVAAVARRYELAARAFQPSGATVDIEYLVVDVQGRQASTVGIERSAVLYTGFTEVQPQVLRVTMMFRFERGTWRIAHRHADDMVDLQLPTP